MATKRVFVPAALHAELTEYTNLVRVLRTTRTLDLTTHLLQHAAQHKGKAKEDADTWTSWPLIDCPVPEWSFGDEIKQLGDYVLRQQTGEADSTTDHDGDDLDSDLDSDLEGLSPTAANRLVFHAGSVLVHILNLMADQRPSAPGSMQNRLWAMNWEDVLSLLAVSNVVDRTVIARAEKRLECIYGPSTTKALDRLQLVASAKAKFSKLVSVQEDQLFAFPVLSRKRPNDTKGRPSRRGGVKSRAIIDTDTDTDA